MTTRQQRADSVRLILEAKFRRYRSRRRIPAPLRQSLRAVKQWLVNGSAPGSSGGTVLQHSSTDTGSLVVALSQFAGEFELPAGAALTGRLLAGQFESYLTDLMRAAVSPGDHVLDVGANLGVYTVLAAKLAGPDGRVLAAEPTPSMLKLLQSNLERNALGNVSIFPGVVSDRVGTCTLEVVAGGEEYSSINGIAHPDVPAGVREKITVASDMLDTLVSRFQLHPAVIKVDTEGAESLVFSHSDATLQNDRPIIFSELDERLLAAHGASAIQVAERWYANKYELFDAQTGEPYARGELPADFVGDVVALPA